MFFEQNDIAQDYAFDANKSTQADQAWVSNIFADQMNNNLDDASKREDASICDDIENEEVISINNISKGEYSYRVVDHIQNYWAGPSYWKFSLNRLSVQTIKPKLNREQTRRLKRQPAKASFIGDHSTDTESDNEVFIKVNSRAARKIRQVNYQVNYHLYLCFCVYLSHSTYIPIYFCFFYSELVTREAETSKKGGSARRFIWILQV